MYASQSRTRRHSLEPTPSSRLIKLHKCYSLDQNTSPLARKRSYEQAFGSNDEEYFDDNVDELFFHPSLEPYMTGGSVTRSTTPLLDFTLKPIGGRRNWKNVVHKQRFEGKLTQHREVTENDDVGSEIVRALRRTIENQIESDPSIIDNSHIHFTMQSDSFSHTFQSTFFTVKEFNDGSERLDMYLQTLAAKLNSNEEFTPDETFTMETTFIHSPGMGRGNGK